ncbi:hypothetical protein NDU88_002860 [Pleurodeles waltl]|uniref:Uncharacterized protein n=1 Tax=Pleurodeles waltl TaxID=8319 RepID=A0AAV7NI91_PLEWA|nr:hypothetical protein NDU88_002860 [Pleurodeles waltl]
MDRRARPMTSSLSVGPSAVVASGGLTEADVSPLSGYWGRGQERRPRLSGPTRAVAPQSGPSFSVPISTASPSHSSSTVALHRLRGYLLHPLLSARQAQPGTRPNLICTAACEPHSAPQGKGGRGTQAKRISSGHTVTAQAPASSAEHDCVCLSTLGLTPHMALRDLGSADRDPITGLVGVQVSSLGETDLSTMDGPNLFRIYGVWRARNGSSAIKRPPSWAVSHAPFTLYGYVTFTLCAVGAWIHLLTALVQPSTPDLGSA